MPEPTSYFELFKDDENRVRYRKGDTIFQAGDLGKELYVVTSGSVAMTAGGELLETVEPGGIFGELALVDEGPRSASAVAATDCELVSISEVRFSGYVRRVPFFGIEVMRVMARRLRRRTAGRP